MCVHTQHTHTHTCAHAVTQRWLPVDKSWPSHVLRVAVQSSRPPSTLQALVVPTRSGAWPPRHGRHDSLATWHHGGRRPGRPRGACSPTLGPVCACGVCTRLRVDACACAGFLVGRDRPAPPRPGPGPQTPSSKWEGCGDRGPGLGWHPPGTPPRTTHLKAGGPDLRGGGDPNRHVAPLPLLTAHQGPTRSHDALTPTPTNVQKTRSDTRAPSTTTPHPASHSHENTASRDTQALTLKHTQDTTDTHTSAHTQDTDTLNLHTNSGHTRHTYTFSHIQDTDTLTPPHLPGHRGTRALPHTLRTHKTLTLLYTLRTQTHSP